jgi:hypothetical protein
MELRVDPALTSMAHLTYLVNNSQFDCCGRWNIAHHVHILIPQGCDVKLHDGGILDLQMEFRVQISSS